MLQSLALGHSSVSNSINRPETHTYIEIPEEFEEVSHKTGSSAEAELRHEERACEAMCREGGVLGLPRYSQPIHNLFTTYSQPYSQPIHNLFPKKK